MNTANLNTLIQRYEDNFEWINNAEHDEIFKWREYMMRIWSINNIVGGIFLKENNYRSWLKGCPRLTEEELNAVENKWKTFVDEIATLGKEMENKNTTL